MRAIELTAPKTLEIKERDMPSPRDKHTIVKVNACGICGSDLHYFEAGLGMNGKPGLVMGHEFCGEICEAGNGFKEGERVVIIPMDSCGECEPCRKDQPGLCVHVMTREIPGNTSPGAYAEYCSIRTDMLRRIPESVSDVEGAMVEPLAVAMHSVNQADLQPGERLLIIGGGPIGILSAKCAALKNIEAVALSEVSEQRLAAAEKMREIEIVFQAKEKGITRKLLEFAGGGFDAVIESSGSEAGIGTALRVLKPRGRLILTGISMQPQKIATVLAIAKEIEIKGAYAYHPSEIEECIELIAHRKVNVTDMGLKQISMEEVPSVIGELMSGKAEALKYVIVHK